jgi:hypothetical protein
MKMIGILHRSSFSLDWSSRPDIPGMRISEIRQPIRFSSTEPRNPSADAKATVGMPSVCIRASKASRTDSSSSIIATTLDPFTVNLLIKHKAEPEMAQLSFGITSEWRKLPIAGADEIHIRDVRRRDNSLLFGFNRVPAEKVPARHHRVLRDRSSRSDILTRSAREPACILCMTRDRCTLTVISRVQSSNAICLLSIPVVTNVIICFSRGVRVSYRSSKGASPASSLRLPTSRARAC